MNPARVSSVEGVIDFNKGRQLLIGAHDEALSLAVMGVSNPDRSPLRVNS
jgi:hypothetical protein